MNKLNQSYEILDRLRLPNGLYVASPSTDYHFVWLRDSFYEVMPYLHSTCDRYEKTYHKMLDIFRKYEWKIDIHTKQKPQQIFEYIHPRYDLNGDEVNQEWGNCQHDAIGAILFGIGEGERAGKKIIRDKKDHEIIQKIISYLSCCNFWEDPDNGMWEEWREIHSSSLGACVAGLRSIKDIVFVPSELIEAGENALTEVLPRESLDRSVDLSQLSLIYPYKQLVGSKAEQLLHRVETTLLRNRGVIRYQGDSYYALNESEGRNHPLNHYIGKEAEWCFGLPWLSLCYFELGNFKKAEEYIYKTEEIMLEDGSLPELYFSNSSKYNGNTPLGWGNAMYILAKEKMNTQKK